MARVRRVVRPDARGVAARVVERVLRDEAYASAVLDAEISRHPQLGVRERALATELTYGALRMRGALLDRLSRHAARGLPSDDPLVMAHLIIAAYQVLALDRVPAHAAVDAAVGAIRAARGKGVGGFANAVLRKLADGGERLDPSRAAIESAPDWLLRALVDSVGRDEAQALLAAGAGVAPSTVAVRVRPGRALPPLLERAPRGRASPLSRLVRRGGDLRQQDGYGGGAFVIQEEGSQLVALSVGARPGERVLDACCGRGQKTTLLVEQVGTDGLVWAADLHEPKLRALVSEAERLGLPAPRTAAVDWTVGPGPIPDELDRVLVDAPCTGTGSLRRRPEIVGRLSADDPGRLADLAARILLGASGRVKRGGRVIYAVCSVLRDECEGVVERVLDRLVPEPFDSEEARRLAGPRATSLRLLPRAHGTDGYFVASFVRR